MLAEYLRLQQLFYSLKKEGEKNPTSLEKKKQIVPNLVTLDIWQVLITMVRFDVSLDLCFRGFYKEEYCYRATDSAGNKTKPTEQSLLRCLQVEKGKWGAQWFDLHDESENTVAN